MKNTVARILKVYAIINAIAGLVLAIIIPLGFDLQHSDGVVIGITIFFIVLVESFLIYCIGEIIQLLQDAKNNSNEEIKLQEDIIKMLGKMQESIKDKITENNPEINSTISKNDEIFTENIEAADAALYTNSPGNVDEIGEYESINYEETEKVNYEENSEIMLLDNFITEIKDVQNVIDVESDFNEVCIEPLTNEELSISTPLSQKNEFLQNWLSGFESTFLGNYKINKSDKTSKIEWLILDKKDNRMLLISKYILEYLPYNEDIKMVSWKDSSLYKWLNNDFINKAFNDEEQKKIQETLLGDINANVSLGRVFILNQKEIEKYFLLNEDRQCVPINFIETDKMISEEFCNYWLRQQDGMKEEAPFVKEDGSIDSEGDLVNIQRFGIRPAMVVRLK